MKPDPAAELVRPIADGLWDQSMRWLAADGRPIPAKIAEIVIEVIEQAGYRIVPGWPQEPELIDGSGGAGTMGE